MNTIKYTGNKITDFLLYTVAQLESERLRIHSGNEKFTLQTIREKTDSYVNEMKSSMPISMNMHQEIDSLSKRIENSLQIAVDDWATFSEERLNEIDIEIKKATTDLAKNHNIYIKDHVLEFSVEEISDIKLSELSKNIKGKNGELYFSDISDMNKPFDISLVTLEQDRQQVVRIEFSGTDKAFNEISRFKENGLLGTGEAEVKRQTPSFDISAENRLEAKEMIDAKQYDELKAFKVNDFILQKPEFQKLYERKIEKANAKLVSEDQDLSI